MVCFGEFGEGSNPLVTGMEVRLRSPMARLAPGLFDGANPLLIVQIPLHRFVETFFERLSRSPAKFPTDLARIHRIPTIVPGPILYESNELPRISTQLRS